MHLRVSSQLSAKCTLQQRLEHEWREKARNARKPFASFVHFVSFVVHNSPRNARCSSVWNRCPAWRSASRGSGCHPESTTLPIDTLCSIKLGWVYFSVSIIIRTMSTIAQIPPTMAARSSRKRAQLLVVRIHHFPILPLFSYFTRCLASS